MSLFYKNTFIVFLFSLFFTFNIFLKGNEEIDLKNNFAVLLPEEVFTDLKEILKQSKRDAPQLSIYQLNLNSAKGNKISASSKKLPQISVGYQINGINKKSSNDNNFSNTQLIAKGELSIRQPIWHWGSLDAEENIGNIQYKLNTIEFNQSKERLLKEIRKVYLEIYSLNLKKQLVAQKLQITQEKLKINQEKSSLKIISNHKLDISYIDLEEVKLESDYIENQIQSLNQYFFALTGGSSAKINLNLTPIQVAKKILNFNNSFGEFKSSPRYQVLEQELKIEENNFVRIKSEQLPKANLVAGFFQDKSNNSSEEIITGRSNIFAGVEVRWNVFDGFRSDGQKISSIAKQKRIKTEIIQEKEKNTREMIHIQREIKIKRQNIDLQVRKLLINKNEIKSQKDLLEKNIIQNVDYLNSKLNCNNISYNIINLIIDYFQTINELLIYSSKI